MWRSLFLLKFHNICSLIVSVFFPFIVSIRQARTHTIQFVYLYVKCLIVVAFVLSFTFIIS